MVNMDYIQ